MSMQKGSVKMILRIILFLIGVLLIIIALANENKTRKK